jgi:hypothetical protein
VTRLPLQKEKLSPDFSSDRVRRFGRLENSTRRSDCANHVV